MLSKLSAATGRVGRGVLRAVAVRPAPARALALAKRSGGICRVFSAPALGSGWSRRGLTTQSPNVIGVPHPLNPSPDTPNPDHSNVRFPDITMTEAHAAAGKTIVELITSDHRCVEKLFATFNAKETIDADKQIAAWKIIRELSIHACVEEELLYQVLKTLGPEGQKYYDSSVKEHSDLKKILFELDEINCDPKNDKTKTLMQHAETANKHHIKEEESEVLPFMEKKLDKEKLKAMGKQYCEYKPMMPTRPHPMAPVGSYLGDRALHLADAVKDKVRFANVKGYMEDPTCASSGAAHTGAAHTK